MSRIGKRPVSVPSGVEVSITGRKVQVKGSKGTLSFEHRPEVTVTHDKDENQLVVDRQGDSREARAYHGTTRSLIANMIHGVTEGYKKELEINGAGWNAQVQGKTLNMNLGYADTRKVPIPMGLEVSVNGNRVSIEGPDKQVVGQFAAVARGQRPPEPYNLKGVKYVDEVITRKEGKAFGG